MDYGQFAGPLLAVAGAALQWARAHKAFKDGWVGVIAVSLGAGVYVLVHVMGPDWRLEVIQALLQIPTHAATVLGGTFTASSLAKAGAPVPMTDSKG